MPACAFLTFCNEKQAAFHTVEFFEHRKWVQMPGRHKGELAIKIAFTDLSRLASCSQV